MQVKSSLISKILNSVSSMSALDRALHSLMLLNDDAYLRASILNFYNIEGCIVKIRWGMPRREQPLNVFAHQCSPSILATRIRSTFSP